MLHSSDHGAIRRIILEQAYRAGVGHIGSALSVADIIETLYERVLDLPSLDAPDRDRFILSKGHSSLALYATLHLRGYLSAEMLRTYCGEGSLLGVHPQHALAGIEFTTGSLGHGLSIGAGAAIAARMDGTAHRVFVLISDAECNEGAVWEAAMFASHHQLANLVAIVDMNGQQALGYTVDVLGLSPLDERWRAFGWNVQDVDGHDRDALEATIGNLDVDAGKPHVLIARTIFGKGVSFMEGLVKWHYQPMTSEEFQLALSEVASH